MIPWARILGDEAKPVRKIGQAIFETTAAFYEALPWFIKWYVRWDYFRAKTKANWREEAERSQLRLNHAFSASRSPAGSAVSGQSG